MSYKIVIGGPVAAGKSTVTTELGKIFTDFTVMNEFEEDDEIFHTLLRWLYEGKDHVSILLQIYLLHKNWIYQKSIDNLDLIVDRYTIENWIFSQVNMRSTPEALKFYNGLYDDYMKSSKLPDLYIILDITNTTFVERLFKRDRKQEVDNYLSNKDYFIELNSTYVSHIIDHCNKYNIRYVIVDANKQLSEVVNTCKYLIETLVLEKES